MLSDFTSIMECYETTGLFSKMPIAVIAIYIALPVIATVICLVMDRKQLFDSQLNTSRNTIHTAVWLLIIFLFPIIGAIVYFLGSLLPYLILSRKQSQKFPYAVPLKGWQLMGVVASGAVGMLAERFLEVDLIYEIAFLGFLVVIAIDWFRTVYHKAIYLQVSTREDKLEENDTILNFPVSRQTVIGDSETKITREIADKLFSEMWCGIGVQGKNGQISRNKVTYHYKVIQTEAQWRIAERDVMEAHYIGNGITKYIILLWNDNSVPFMERAVYRAMPKSQNWLARMLILQFIILSLYSDLGAFFHIPAVNFIAGILG